MKRSGFFGAVKPERSYSPLAFPGNQQEAPQILQIRVIQREADHGSGAAFALMRRLDIDIGEIGKGR